MKIILFKQFSATVFKNLWMDISAFKGSLETPCTRTSACQCCFFTRPHDLPVFSDPEAGKRKNDIKLTLSPVESGLIASVADWIHCSIDQHDQMIAELVLVLSFG